MAAAIDRTRRTAGRSDGLCLLPRNIPYEATGAISGLWVTGMPPSWGADSLAVDATKPAASAKKAEAMLSVSSSKPENIFEENLWSPLSATKRKRTSKNN